jgi:hypothetical protein
MVFSPPRTTDPVVTLQAIRERWPQVGTQKLLDIFYAVALEDRQLHRAIIAQSFAHALEQLSLPDRQPRG